MRSILKNNIEFYLIAFVWMLSGYLMPLSAYLIIPATVILFRYRERYQDILTGFLLILVLSDNLEDTFEFSKEFKNLYILMLAFIFIADRFRYKDLNRNFIYFIPFFLVAIFCLLFSGSNIVTAAMKTLSYILLFLTIPNFVIKSYEEQGKWFFKNLLYFIFFIVLFGYLYLYIDYEFSVSHGGRLRGVFGNPNGLGIFLILFFILFFVVNWYFPDLFSRNEKILITILLLFFIYKTGSRTALIAVCLFTSFIWIARYSTFLGIILFLGTVVYTEYILSNLEQVIKGTQLEKIFRLETLDEGSGRFVAWKFAWENIQKSFFFGRGFAYDEYLMRANLKYLSKLGHEGGVHNTYLILWLNTGIVGLVAFLRGFFLLFIKAAKNTPLAIPAMYAIMFSINFEPWLAASLNPFTILFLIIITIMTDDTFQKANNKEAEKSEINNNEALA